MLAHQLGAARAQHGAHDERNDDRVVQLSRDRDEVRDEVERHGQVSRRARL
jgi:hypothetical protein